MHSLTISLEALINQLDFCPSRHPYILNSLKVWINSLTITMIWQQTNKQTKLHQTYQVMYETHTTLNESGWMTSNDPHVDHNQVIIIVQWTQTWNHTIYIETSPVALTKDKCKKIVFYFVVGQFLDFFTSLNEFKIFKIYHRCTTLSYTSTHRARY